MTDSYEKALKAQAEDFAKRQSNFLWELERANRILIAALVSSAGGSLVVTQKGLSDATACSLVVKEDPKARQIVYSVEASQ